MNLSKLIDNELYPKWVVRACDRIARKSDDEQLTNEEAEALVEYLHGDLFADQ